jgi:hypothetical protein
MKKSKNILILIIIEKCEKVKKRDRKFPAHYRGMAYCQTLPLFLVLKSKIINKQLKTQKLFY